MGIEMNDLSLLEITKVKPWAIYFDYDNKHYLLHGKVDDYESIQELYERQLDKNGNYDLIFIKSRYGRDYLDSDYIKSISRKTIVYNQIDKEYFREQLKRSGFVELVEKEKEPIKRTWTKWEFYYLDFYDTNGHYIILESLFRDNGKYVQMKLRDGSLKASATCRNNDKFSLKKGLKLAEKRLIVKYLAREAKEYADSL